MPKFRISKSSSSTSKRKTRAGRTKPKRAKAGDPKFSILKFKFAVPASLNNLLRLAACFALLAHVSVQAGPGSLWKEESPRSIRSKCNQASMTSGIYQDMITSQFADGISRSGGLGLARSLEARLSRQTSASETKEKP
jgi:hypothetical protein